jgi:hypothetical protein
MRHDARKAGARIRMLREWAMTEPDGQAASRQMVSRITSAGAVVAAEAALQCSPTFG